MRFREVYVDMKKTFFIVFFAAFAISFLIQTNPAEAYLYDDFTDVGISNAKWTDRGPNQGFFTQPGDSYLYYNDPTGGHKDELMVAQRPSGAFFVSMQYSSFLSNNIQPSGIQRGSAAMLVAGFSSGPAVGIYEYQNSTGKGFEAIYTINGVARAFTNIKTNVDSGWLGIGYNGILGSGGVTTLWIDPGTGWSKLAKFYPSFASSPGVGIEGWNPSSSSLSFQVDKVVLSPNSQPPVPIPAAVWLLGSGLVGLAGLRKRFTK